MKTKVYCKYGLVLGLVGLLSQNIQGQNVSISATPSNPHPAAGLDIQFSDRGLLIPRVNLSAATTWNPPISAGSPTTSLLVYNQANTVNGPGYYYWNGSRWVRLLTTGVPSDAWLTTGNAGTTAGTHFVGTTDAQALDFRTNNTIRLRMSTTEAIFNNLSLDYDFRIQTTAQNDMFVVDASTNRIGINAGIAPTNPLTFYSTGENAWLTYWENATTAGALAQFYHTTTGNGKRVLMGVTNYNGSTYQAPGVIGLSLNTTATGSGGVGVEADANNESGVALYASLYYSGGYTGWAGYFNADVYCGGTYVGSDIKLKKDISPIYSAINTIKKLNPVSFYYDTEKYPKAGFDERLRYGFIAQEMESVLPTLVKEKNIILNSNTEKKPGMQSEPLQEEKFKVVDYISLIPILTKAIQEQQEMIEKQQAEINELKKLLTQQKDK